MARFINGTLNDPRYSWLIEEINELNGPTVSRPLSANTTQQNPGCLRRRNVSDEIQNGGNVHRVYDSGNSALGSLSNLVNNLPSLIGNPRDTLNPVELPTRVSTTATVTRAQVHATASGPITTNLPQTEQSTSGIDAQSVVNDNEVWDDNLFEAWDAASFSQDEPSSPPLPDNQEAYRAASTTNQTPNIVEGLRNEEEPTYSALCDRLDLITEDLRIAREERRRDRRMLENFKRVVSDQISRNSVGLRENIASSRLIRNAVKYILDNQAQSVVLFMEIINMSRRISGE
ncbi:uncharacterized protein LOC130417428 [Triplophysa dalaica]|uniref:uncharacterized protein LOC130417428 n=1 Tax=Triplophysa dalaica TaxID=1582913 RepID=UPI0024DF462E|nr:uncharacterized protein LOC130417428 [Triplophysa dalaica]